MLIKIWKFPVSVLSYSLCWKQCLQKMWCSCCFSVWKWSEARWYRWKCDVSSLYTEQIQTHIHTCILCVFAHSFADFCIHTRTSCEFTILIRSFSLQNFTVLSKGTKIQPMKMKRNTYKCGMRVKYCILEAFQWKLLDVFYTIWLFVKFTPRFDKVYHRFLKSSPRPVVPGPSTSISMHKWPLCLPASRCPHQCDGTPPIFRQLEFFFGCIRIAEVSIFQCLQMWESIKWFLPFVHASSKQTNLFVYSHQALYQATSIGSVLSTLIVVVIVSSSRFFTCSFQLIYNSTHHTNICVVKVNHHWWESMENACICLSISLSVCRYILAAI